MLDTQFSKQYSEVFDLLHHDKDYRSEVEFVLNLANDALGHTPSAVLDLACGSGGHLARFIEQNIRAHGNDVSSTMVQCAERRLSNLSREKFSLSNAPMQTLSRKILPPALKFELAATFYTALGYLTNPDQLHQFFETLRNLLEPGGCFFADVWNETKMAHAFSPHRSKRAQNDLFEVERESLTTHEPHIKCLNVKFQFHVREKHSGQETIFNEDHLVRYFTPSELESVLSIHHFKLLSHGPFFDPSNDINECWNFFIFAQLKSQHA